MSLFEEQIDLVREDGMTLPGVRVTPDFEAAAKCNGAGVIIVAGESGLDEAIRTRFVTPIATYGYFVVACDLVRGRIAESPEAARERARGLDHAIAIDDIVAALLTVKQLASGKLGVVGIGVAAAIAVEAATQLPHIDAVVCVDGPPPARDARLARMRAAVAFHRAQNGTLLSRADFDDIYARCKRGKAQLLCDDYPAGDGFFAHPRDDDEALQSRMAWDRTRDFLSFALL